MRCTNVTKVPYDVNNENNGQTDLKIIFLCKLVSLNTAYIRRITIITITIVVVKVISLKVVDGRGLHDCDTTLTSYQHMKILF